MNIRLGNLIEESRIRLNISQKNLCEGICDVSAYSRYMLNERTLDYLLLRRIIQRLGILGQDEIAIMMSKDEYEYVEWKNQTQELIYEGKWSELAKELKRTDGKCNERLEKQYKLYLQAVYEAKVNENHTQAARYLENAILMTVPGILEIGKRTLIIGNFELKLAIFYLYEAYKSEILERSRIKVLLESVINYIEKRNLEEFDSAYSDAVCMEYELFSEEIENEKLAKHLENVKELEVKNTRFFRLDTVLIYLTQVYEKMNNPMKNKIGAQSEAVGLLMKKYGIYKPPYYERIEDNPKNIIHLTEVLHNQRIYLGLTQEELSEGICAVETYSRIESGKRTPRKSNYKALLSRLQIGYGYYNTDIETEAMELEKKKRQLSAAMYRGMYDEAGKLIEILRDGLDMKLIKNRQFVEGQEAILLYKKGEIDEAGLYDRVKGAYELTRDRYASEKSGIPLQKNEIKLCNYMALALEKMGRMEEAKELLRNVLKNQRETTKHTKEFLYKTQMILGNLAIFCARTGEYKEASEIVSFSIKQGIKEGSVGAIGGNILTNAHCMQKMKADIEDIKKEYRNAFYIADLFDERTNSSIAKTCYEREFEPDFKWY